MYFSLDSCADRGYQRADRITSTRRHERSCAGSELRIRRGRPAHGVSSLFALYLPSRLSSGSCSSAWVSERHPDEPEPECAQTCGGFSFSLANRPSVPEYYSIPNYEIGGSTQRTAASVALEFRANYNISKTQPYRGDLSGIEEGRSRFFLNAYRSALQESDSGLPRETIEAGRSLPFE